MAQIVEPTPTQTQREFVGDVNGGASTAGWRPFSTHDNIEPSLEAEPRARIDDETAALLRHLQRTRRGWIPADVLGPFADQPLSDREQRLAEMLVDPPTSGIRSKSAEEP